MSPHNTAPSTEGFDSEWLTLRRDADARARTESTEALLHAIALPGSQKRLSPLDIVDLGSGSGSNALYLMPNLAASGVHRQRWVLVDRDEDLLEEAVSALAEETSRVSETIGATLEIEVSTCCVDMATEMDDVPIKGAQLVTASALLDLVSGHWVTDLSSRLEHFHVGAALMTLNFDGHVEWSPMEPSYDDKIMAAFHADMRRDKGFGPALGSDAVTTFGRATVKRGTTVQCFDASWILDDLDTELQERYLEDIHRTLRGSDVDASLVKEWYERRRRWIDTDESDLVVGHYDILALRAPV
ncbi:MAG: hypothetical protein ACJA2W_000001 [Planctomycetota bacterium]|jgi:hypothetical protein